MLSWASVLPLFCSVGIGTYVLRNSVSKVKDDGWGTGQCFDIERLAIHIQQMNAGKLKIPFINQTDFELWTGLALRERSSNQGQGVEVAPQAACVGKP